MNPMCRMTVLYIRLTLLTDSEIQRIFEKEKPDYVYHFAAYAAVCLSPFIRNFNYQNNIVCSANIINACINNSVKKLIFSSSMDVYGELRSSFYGGYCIPASRRSIWNRQVCSRT